MKRFKTTHFRILGMFVLIAGLTFTSCNDSSTSAIGDVEKEMKLASHKGSDLTSNTQVSNNIILDTFNSGAGTFSGSGHNSKFEYHESTTILGGAREIYLRDAASGTLGGATYATIDTDMGTLRLYTTGGAAPENAVMYGTSIGTIYRSWAPSPNIGKGTQLNLDLTIEDFILIEVAASGNNSDVTIVLRSGNGAVNSANFTLNTGPNFIPLSDFPNMTEQAASDIDGIAISGLNTFETFAIKKAEPVIETNVYISDNSVDTYDPIFPATADPNWASTVCYQSNSFGIDATWSNPHKAFQVTKDPSPHGAPHPWESNTFEAYWINAVNDMDSHDTKDINGNAGPGGHNWTRYDQQVAGNGDFVVQLLADNCSWIYLADESGNSPQLVGYQGAVSTPGEYGVSLDGNHTLIFIIFDGGGLAGGKFRLETTESFGGEAPPPIEPPAPVNNAPVANAGADQTLEATGPATSVTLDGSGSTDADGDKLTYEWSNGSTDVSTNVNLGVGVHTFTLTVTDEQGATDSDEVVITITDTTAPVLSFNQVTGNLWPPNHKMVLVATGISASDIVDGATEVTVTVSSNEASNGKGDGNTDSDYEIVMNPDGTQDVYVRSERSGKGNGRIYTISMSTSDVAGNGSSDSFDVHVAQSQGRGK